MPAFLRLGLLSAIWGSSFLFIKVALDGLSPTQIVFGRLVCGAAVLLAVLAARGEALPASRSVWVHLAANAVIANIVPFFLFAWGEQRIPSATAGVLNATTPLFTTLAVFFGLPEERPTREKATGLAVGFLGVLILMGGATGGGLAGAVACLGAAACYGVSFVYMRRALTPTGLSPLVLSAGQILSATVLMALAAPLVAVDPVDLEADVVLSILALGVLGTGLAYLLSWSLIRDLGATGASLVTYLIPIAAVALGVLVLGERPGWNLPVGGAVVILGVAIAQGQAARPPSGTPAAVTADSSSG